jgi:hypothetical protein
LAYVQGVLGYEDACEKLCEICSSEKRAAEKHLADMKPRAEAILASLTPPE